MIGTITNQKSEICNQKSMTRRRYMAREIIDFHTHAFPDALAARAMKALLEEAPGIKAYLDGTVGDLLRSMDRSGIETSVVCCIATKGGQFGPLLRWGREFASGAMVH